MQQASTLQVDAHSVRIADASGSEVCWLSPSDCATRAGKTHDWASDAGAAARASNTPLNADQMCKGAVLLPVSKRKYEIRPSSHKLQEAADSSFMRTIEWCTQGAVPLLVSEHKIWGAGSASEGLRRTVQTRDLRDYSGHAMMPRTRRSVTAVAPHHVTDMPRARASDV